MRWICYEDMNIRTVGTDSDTAPGDGGECHNDEEPQSIYYCLNMTYINQPFLHIT